MNKRAFLIGAVMVLLVNFVAVALRAYAEAAFLQSYDKTNLPWLLVANAAGFAVATFVYDLVTRRAHAKHVDLVLLLALIATTATAPALLRAGAPPVFLVVAIAAVSQVVGLALWNRVAEAVAGRDARRNLPRAGAMVTAGGMIAGLGAGLLGIKGDLLPYLGAGVTAIVVVLSFAQTRALATGGAPGAALPPGASDVLGPPQLSLRRALIAVAVLEGVIATVVDFQFLAELRSGYTGDRFTIALLLFYGGTNAFLLLLQTTAVPRLLVTRSLPTTNAVHPTLVVLWYVGFLFAPGLIAIAGTRTTDQVFRLATSRTAQEVSLSAFPPVPRARWKVLLRGAVWSAGAAGTALVLVVLGPNTLDYPTRIAGAAIGIAIVWWIAARISARRFQTALAAPLAISASREIDDPTRIDLATLEEWTHAAGDDDTTTAALGRAALSRAKVDVTDLADQLRHDEPAVRAALFDQIARSPSPALLRELRAAVQIEDDDRAMVFGLKALAIAGDDGGLERGKSRAALSRDVADAVRTSELTLRGGPDVASEISALCERDPSWAVALIRAQRTRDAVAAKAADAKAAKTADAKTADAKTGDAKTGDAKTGDAKTGDAKTGDAKTGDAKTGDARTADAKTADAKTGDAKTGDARTGDAKTADAKTGDAKPTAKPKASTDGSKGKSGAKPPPVVAAPLDEATLSTLLDEASSTPARRAGALIVIAHVGPPEALSILDLALAASEPAAIRAIGALDDAGVAALAVSLGARTPNRKRSRRGAERPPSSSGSEADLLATEPSQRIRPPTSSGSETGEPSRGIRLPSSSGSEADLLVSSPGVPSAATTTFTPLARLTMARALAATPNATAAVGALLEDPDPEVAHAALRTALAIARGGASLPSAPIAAAHRAALAALVATLDARDAAHAASLAVRDDEGAVTWSACARHELELATRSCVARLMWATAVEVAAAGRDPAALAATARRLIGGREPDRRRALDVIQELQAGRVEILAVIERWLRPATAKAGSPDALAAHDPWLTSLCRGELAALEPTIAILRKPALFASVSGPALAAVASRAKTRTVKGELFEVDDAGLSMFVVAKGTLVAHRDPNPPRRIEVGGVVGELAVLTGAPRAATVLSDGAAEVVEIDRDTFAAASRRAPELVLGLSATLAGWLAPNRPDVL